MQQKYTVMVVINVFQVLPLPLYCHWLIGRKSVWITHFHLFVGFCHKMQLFGTGFVCFPGQLPCVASCLLSLGSFLFPFCGYLVSFFSLVISSPQSQFCPLLEVASSKPATLLALALGMDPTHLRGPGEPPSSALPAGFFESSRFPLKTFSLFPQACLFRPFVEMTKEWEAGAAIEGCVLSSILNCAVSNHLGNGQP